MMWHDGWGAGSWLLMSFMMVLFWVFVVGFVVWAVRGHHHAPPPPDSTRARQILDECFARGEIDADEYAQRRDHLAAR
jgi:putative membrane protein